MSDLPQRTGPPPAAIDVDGREAAPVPVAPSPVQPGDTGVASPKAEPLTGPELIEEGTRLVVGSAMLVGRALRQLLDPNAPVSANGSAGSDEGDADGGGERGVEPNEPEGIVAALPTALLGWSVHTQRRALDAAFDARERLGPALSWVLDQPFVSPAYQRVRTRVLEWYEVGENEKAASSHYASGFLTDASDEGLGLVYQKLDLNVITSGFNVQPLLEDLELNDVIVHSTGGLAGLAIDKVRAQGVTVDAIIERFFGRFTRRKGTPMGPPGRYGLDGGRRSALPAET